MSFVHSNVYIVRVVDTDPDGAANTWFVGPYGNTRAEQTAADLAAATRDTAGSRECHIEALFSDDACLCVTDYGRASRGSLR